TRADAIQHLADTLTAHGGPIAGKTIAGPAWATITARTAAADLASTTAQRAAAQPAAERAAQLSWEAIVDVGRSAAADAQLAAAYGIRLHNPFTDSAVIAAALAASGWQRGSPTAYKPLLVGAMADLLPSAVADRHTKGDSTIDHICGLRANLRQVLQLADGHLAAAGLIDPGQLRTLLTRAAAGLPVSAAAVEPVVATEVWLRSLTIAPDIRWETTKIEQISARSM
ncbi:MAG TPA: asparagine synthase-related protein, partial [Mycobacteriales bacterium]